MRDIALLAAVVISLPICFFRPAIGMVIWTVLGFLNPQSFTFGIARSAPLAEAVAIATLAGFIVSGRYKSLICKEVLLLFVLWVWFTVTTLASVQAPILATKAADAWYRWGFVSKIMLMTAVTVGIVDTWQKLRWLFLAIGGSFALLVFHTLPGIILSGGNFRVYGPDNSMVADNTAFGLAVDMAVPFFLYLAKTEYNKYLKWCMWVAFVGSIPSVFFTYSRGAFLGLLALAGCMFLQSKQKALLIPVAVLTLLFGAFVAPQKWRDRISESTDTKESSAESRINTWHFCFNLVKDFPLMGGGFEPYTKSLYDRYAPNGSEVHSSHSIYFGVLVEHGFVGFVLYFWLVGDCFLVLRRIVKRADMYGEDSTSYSNMLRFSLIAFLAAGAFLGRQYFDFYFMIVSCTAILNRVCHEDWAANRLVLEESDEDTGSADLALPDSAAI